MQEKIEPVRIPEPKESASRPVLLSVLCLFSWVYFALIAIIFLLATFNSVSITRVLNTYIPQQVTSQTQVLLLFLTGFFMNVIGLVGGILVWNLRRVGYYILALDCLALAAYQLLLPHAAISTTAVYVLLVFLFGAFFRKLK